MKYQCPHCKEALHWTLENPHRPFCSDHCKNADLLGWANEEHRLTTQDPIKDWTEEQ